jgi:F-box protein 25/32
MDTTRCESLGIYSAEQTSFSGRWLEDEDNENLMPYNLALQEFYSKKSGADDTMEPHCHIVIKCTREITGFNKLSDAFKRLDFRSAVHDVRRFTVLANC